MAEDPFEKLKAFAVPDDHEEVPDGVTVESFDDGKHHHVILRFQGRGGALDPDQARAFAEDLWAAADEAETLNAS